MPQNPEKSLEKQDAKLDFEQALEQLQQTVKKLESGELSLDQALQNFEEGVRLSRLCQKQLGEAEQRVDLLIKANPDGTIETQPFRS